MTEAAEKNGKDNSLPPPQEAMQRMMDQFIWPVLACAVNGLTVGLRQIPVGGVLVRASGLFGRVIGETLSMGNLSSVLQIRAECIKAFTAGVREVTIKPPPGNILSDVKMPTRQ